MNYLFLLIALVFPALSFAQAEIPALIRTTIPSGDATGGKVDYTIPLGDSRSLRLRVDAGKLSVAVSGSVKDQFAIFTVADGEYTPLECSAGFLGAFTGTVTCPGVLPGVRLVFVRKDYVDALVPRAEEAIMEEEGVAEGEAEEFIDEEEEQFTFGDEDFFVGGAEEEFAEEEEEPGFFETVGDFFTGLFGGEEEAPEVLPEEEEFGEEFIDEEEERFTFDDEGFVFDGGMEEEFAEEEFAAEEEPGFFETVADFFGFGGEEEVLPEEEFVIGEEGEEIVEEEFGEEFIGEEEERFTFGEEDLLVGGGVEEEFAPEEFAEVEEGEGAVREEKSLRELIREAGQATKAVVTAVQYKVADFITRLYVKPLPLAPEAAEEGVIDEGM
ncbi:MAG: hypothetical protein HYW56_02250 [Candidatus Harrisonbacteria bacterium]|nr:hypothetical protein [Candidatus Harrisonbacteria bacterium]